MNRSGFMLAIYKYLYGNTSDKFAFAGAITSLPIPADLPCSPHG